MTGSTALSAEDLAGIVRRASTLGERLGCCATACTAGNGIDTVRTACHVERWQHVLGDGDATLDRRLEWDGLDRPSALQALTSPPEVDGEALPHWALTLNGVLAQLTRPADPRTRRPLFVTADAPVPFEEVLVPFVTHASGALARAAGQSYRLLSPSAVTVLERALLQLLAHVTAAPLALEFSLHRAKDGPVGTALGVRLPGESDAAYRRFVLELLEGRLAEVLGEYCVLARLLGTMVDHWVEANAEFLERLQEDWEAIGECFRVESSTRSVAVRPYLSDLHLGGRSVMAVQFASGGKVVYKPRPVDMESAYHELVLWLNRRGLEPPLQAPAVLAREQYGWTAFAEPLPSETEEQVGQYYRRAGMILCLAHALGGRDLHAENLLACGEHPVLVDLETLCHPAVVDRDDPDHEVVNGSVLRTGLLPWVGPSSEGYDASGFGARGHEEVRLQIPTWHAVNTDEMALRYQRYTLPVYPNMPSCGGVRRPAPEFAEKIVNGFAAMARFLSRHVRTGRQGGDPFSRFESARGRLVFRQTQVYSALIGRTLQPEYLRDGARRSIEFEILRRTALRRRRRPAWWPMVDAEIRALEMLDVPSFWISPATGTVTAPSGEPVDGCLAPDGTVRERIQALDEAEVERQVRIIRSSLGAGKHG